MPLWTGTYNKDKELKIERDRMRKEDRALGKAEENEEEWGSEDEGVDVPVFPERRDNYLCNSQLCNKQRPFQRAKL